MVIFTDIRLSFFGAHADDVVHEVDICRIRLLAVGASSPTEANQRANIHATQHANQPIAHPDLMRKSFHKGTSGHRRTTTSDLVGVHQLGEAVVAYRHTAAGDHVGHGFAA